MSREQPRTWVRAGIRQQGKETFSIIRMSFDLFNRTLVFSNGDFRAEIDRRSRELCKHLTDLVIELWSDDGRVQVAVISQLPIHEFLTQNPVRTPFQTSMNSMSLLCCSVGNRDMNS